MDKIAKGLTDYLICNGMIDEANRSVYEYGLTITMEAGFFALFSFCTALYLHMFIEGILFFVVFAPLRSYAGGLHLKNFWSCFILSCLTFFGILLIVRHIRVPIAFSLVVLLILEACVYVLYPVENVNRKVDEDENRYFRRKLKQFLMLDLLIAVICTALESDRCILLITITLFMVVLTMILGKYKNKKNAGFM